MNRSENRVKVGVIGLGRSGWGIHVKAFAELPDLYKVVALHDPWQLRLSESALALGARAHHSIEGLLRDDEVQLIVVASPSKFHFEHALAALEAGKHVLCDKPFGTTTAEVDQLIEAAAHKKRIIQPFQQRRYETDFLEVKRVCDSGVLGRIEFIRICWHSFKRRWDWQTISAMAGGELYNNGPHPVDHALLLFDGNDGTSSSVEPDVWCERRRFLASGDAEDHVKIILSAPDHPTVDIELSSIFAYGQDRWLVCGSSGGLRGGSDSLQWKWVDWSSMPARPLDPQSTPDRSYNSESLSWHTGTWNPHTAADAGSGAPPAMQPVLDLYRDLHATLNYGIPQVITPQSVRRRISVLERCAAIAPVRK